jgi:hypothetical protein
VDAASQLPQMTGLATPTRVGGWHRRRARFRFAVAIVLTGTGFLLALRSGFASPPGTIVSGSLPVLLAMLAALTYSSVGLVLTLRRPEVRIGSLSAWTGELVAGLTLAWGYLAVAGTPIGSTWPGGAFVSLIAAVVVTPFIPALGIGLMLLFPTDRLLSPAWRRVVWLALAGATAASVGRLLRDAPVTFVGHYDNPIAVPALEPLPSILQATGFAALGVCGVLAGACLVRRYARSDAITRAQLRVFTAVAIAQAAVFIPFVAGFLVPSLQMGARDTIVVLNLLVFAASPLAIALAIARYRLLDMDHLVGRTFVYGALTAILAGVYAASIQLFTALFKVVTGESSDAALVVTALVLATTFTPIKTQLEALLRRWHGMPDAAAGQPAVVGQPAAAAQPALVGQPAVVGQPAAAGLASGQPASVPASVDLLADPAFERRVRELVRAEMDMRDDAR